MSYTALVAMLTAVTSASAGNRTLVYNRIMVEMTVNKDTSIDVIERQEVTMGGDWNGLFRNYALARPV